MVVYFQFTKILTDNIKVNNKLRKTSVWKFLTCMDKNFLEKLMFTQTEPSYIYSITFDNKLLLNPIILI